MRVSPRSQANARLRVAAENAQTINYRDTITQYIAVVNLFVLYIVAYFTSGSRFSNSGAVKKSIRVMSNPSQIFLMVRILGSLLLPYRMFLMDDGGSADNVASLLIVIFLSLHRRNILSRIAETVSISYAYFPFSQAYKISLAKVGYPCHYIGYT